MATWKVIILSLNIRVAHDGPKDYACDGDY